MTKKSNKFEGLNWPVELASGGSIDVGAAVADALDQFCEDFVFVFEPDGRSLCVPGTPQYDAISGKPALSLEACKPGLRHWTSGYEDYVIAPISLESIVLTYAEEESYHWGKEGVPDAMSKALIKAAESIEKLAATLRQRAAT
jgi:hypothetical protein